MGFLASRPRLALAFGRAGCAVVVAATAGCHIFSTALPCGDDDGCGAGSVCVDGFCAEVGNVAGEGEGDVVVGEGEGDVVVGEGEGDTVVGEGEGDTVVGEGEGDVVVGEGEGEGDVVVGEGEGEGEGDVVVDPCPPIFENDFARNFVAASNLPAGASASVVNNRLELVAGATGADKHAGMGGPAGSPAGKVLEFTMTVNARPSFRSEAGFQFTALNPATDFDVRVDVFENLLGMIAVFPDGSFRTAPTPVAFTTGTITAQLRLDGPNPVLHVNGVTMVLDVASSALTAHGIDFIAGCELEACGGASLTVSRVALYNSCRP